MAARVPPRRRGGTGPDANAPPARSTCPSRSCRHEIPTAVLTRWDAGLAPSVGTGVVALSGLRLVTAVGDVVTTVRELPEALGPADLAVDPAGGTACLALRETDPSYAVLLVADLATGTTDTVDLCRYGGVDDVAVADDGEVWVSGVRDDDAVIWAVG